MAKVIAFLVLLPCFIGLCYDIDTCQDWITDGEEVWVAWGWGGDKVTPVPDGPPVTVMARAYFERPARNLEQEQDEVIIITVPPMPEDWPPQWPKGNYDG
jgi:hypothetical protein